MFKPSFNLLKILYHTIEDKAVKAKLSAPLVLGFACPAIL